MFVAGMPRYTRGQYEWFFRETDTDDDGHISLRDLENVLARFKYPIDGVTLRVTFPFLIPPFDYCLLLTIIVYTDDKAGVCDVLRRCCVFSAFFERRI